MRTSILSRSVIAIATLGITSAVLGTAPATAAAPSGITRDMVLTAAANTRAADGGDVDEATGAITTAMASAACALVEGEQVLFSYGEPTQAGDDADGILVLALVGGEDTFRVCTFGAAAVVDPAFALTGSGTITSAASDDETPTTKTVALSGDVAVTPPVSFEGFAAVTSTFTAAGNAARTTSVPVTKKVADKKSKAEKKAAKKKYEKRLKAAKKKYTKALDKAGKSKSRKAAAKKTYSAAKASAKKKYRSAIVNYKVVRTTVTTTENRPFSITASTTAD